LLWLSIIRFGEEVRGMDKFRWRIGL